MSESHAFTTVCEELENQSALDRLEARGTVRLMLKQAGLEPKTVTASQLSVAVEKILPAELETRGIANSATLCSHLCTALRALPDEDRADESPEAVFSRLGGS